MKRRTSTSPVKIYSYGCRLPTYNAELIERQLLNAHRYYNTLIEIERRRRERVRVAQSASAPDVADAEARLERLNAAIERGFELCKSKKSEARSSKIDLDAERSALKSLRSQRKSCIEQLRSAKKTARSPELLAEFAKISEEAKAEIREARARCNVYWGTYLLIEQAADSAAKSKTDPEFKRWNGCGRIGVQFQGGIPVAELFENDMRLQIQMLPTGSKRGATMAEVMIRIGSDDERQAIWAVFPFRLHRPLPADGIVKSAFVTKSMKGRWVNWDLQIVVEAESMAKPIRPISDGGVVAIDIGWRKRNSGDLRVAYWVDDQGKDGEILIPSNILERLRHSESIRSIADRNFDLSRSQLVTWLEGKQLPECMSKDVKFMPKCRAPNRLGRFIDLWTQNRFDGDTETYTTMKEWWKQQRHLKDWESCERDRTLGAREMLYRRLAYKLTKKYAVVVLEKFDLRNVATLQMPDSTKTDLPKPIRRNRTIAACSDLVKAIKNSALGNGCRIVEVDCKDTTTNCSKCGERIDFDRSDLICVCERCRERGGGDPVPIDQDRMAAENLLNAWNANPSRSQTTSQDTEIIDSSSGAVSNPAQGDVP